MRHQKEHGPAGLEHVDAALEQSFGLVETVFLVGERAERSPNLVGAHVPFGAESRHCRGGRFGVTARRSQGAGFEFSLREDGFQDDAVELFRIAGVRARSFVERTGGAQIVGVDVAAQPECQGVGDGDTCPRDSRRVVGQRRFGPHQPDMCVVERSDEGERERVFEHQVGRHADSHAAELVDPFPDHLAAAGEELAEHSSAQQPGYERGVFGEDCMANRASWVVVLRVPVAGAAVQFERTIVMASGENAAEELREEVVVPIERALVVERHDEEVLALQ